MREFDSPAYGKAKIMRTVVWRAVGTVASILIYGWINFLLNPVGTVLTGEVAGRQFDSSNASYVGSVVGMNIFGHLGIPFVILLAVIAAIWWGPARRALMSAALVGTRRGGIDLRRPASACSPSRGTRRGSRASRADAGSSAG